MKGIQVCLAVLLSLSLCWGCSGESGTGSVSDNGTQLDVGNGDLEFDLFADQMADTVSGDARDALETSDSGDDPQPDLTGDSVDDDMANDESHDTQGDSADLPDQTSDTRIDLADSLDDPDQSDLNDPDATQDESVDLFDDSVDTEADPPVDDLDLVSRDETDTGTVLCDVEYPEHTVGLQVCAPETSEGYTLFAPLRATTAYLIDILGRKVHSWQLDYFPGMVVYLLENGSLLATGNYSPSETPRLDGGGQGGIVQLYDWDGTLTWSYEYSTEDHRQHHDVEMLPNGNVLLVAWEYNTFADIEELGRTTEVNGDDLWTDTIIEVKPTGLYTGDIVWEWRALEHIIQDSDSEKPDYGDPAEHPELIDLNYQIGQSRDWLHINSVDYNAEFDQIVVSSHNTGEMWILDHSTTAEEVGSHAGGDGGRGGDLLYRWGNPEAYGQGSTSDRQLFGQHDTYWIEAGRPGAGNVLAFDNGVRRSGRYSRIVEVVTPVTEDGAYPLIGETYGPAAPVWTYEADPRNSFFASNISGSQRMPNGNTLITDGPNGHFFEVTEAGEVVWRYINPVTGGGILEQGETATGTGPSASQRVFRAYRYEPSYPAFTGRDLTPGDVIEL